MNLKGRDFLKLLDFSGKEITYLIDLAEKLKTLKKDGVPHRYCNGKNIALIFERQAHGRGAVLKLRRTTSAWE